MKELKAKIKSQANLVITALSKINNVFYVLLFFFLPLYVVFIGGGNISRVILGVYTLIIVILSFSLIYGFFRYVAEFLNERSDRFGTLLMSYLQNFFIPLLALRFAAFVLFRILPLKHYGGILCDAVELVKNIFFIFKIQYYLELLTTYSFLAIGALVLILIVKNSSRN